MRIELSKIVVMERGRARRSCRAICEEGSGVAVVGRDWER